MTVWDIYFSLSLKCVFILCVYMHTAIFSNFNLFGENKNWRIVNKERKIVYRFYTENFIVNETSVYIQVWKLKARTNWKTLPQREVLKAKSSAVVLLYSTDTWCDISTYERVLFSMMGVAKRSNCWLAGWKLQHSNGFPINCRTVFSPSRGRKYCYKFKSSPNFKSFVR